MALFKSKSTDLYKMYLGFSSIAQFLQEIDLRTDYLLVLIFANVQSLEASHSIVTLIQQHQFLYVHLVFLFQ
jgi:hypothetical protein